MKEDLKMATWSKEVLAKNLQRYLSESEKSQKELAAIVGVSAPTVNEWLKAKKYPRIDKIEKMANYFGILKSDLIEDKEKNTNDFYTDEEIGTKIKEARISKKLTQSELGAMLGVTESTVTRWENGAIKNIKRDMLQKIAETLDIPPFPLMGFKDDDIDPATERKNNQQDKQRKLWADAYADVEFSDAEFEDIMKYANFLISQRK